MLFLSFIVTHAPNLGWSQVIKMLVAEWLLMIHIQ